MIEQILTSYPRVRPPLGEAHQRIYAEQYKLNREGGSAVDGASQRLERWMHRKVASQEGGPVLELGAGTLNHLAFEPETYDYDVVEPFTALYQDRPEKQRVRSFYDSVQEIPLDQRYRRIISIAVLEHLTDLPRDLAHSALLLDEAGVFQAGIPSEGGFLWWLAWRNSTGLAYFFRTGLNYGVVMRHEHVNNSPTIVALVRHFFHDVAVKRFPSPLHNLSFYAYVEARRPKRDVAERYLSGSESASV